MHVIKLNSTKLNATKLNTVKLNNSVPVHWQPEILRFTVRALEDMGVSACIIEDKCGLKQNSLFGTTRQQTLEDIPLFCDKIAAATAARTNRKFMVIARIEALISGAGEAEAIRRAVAYIAAGADAIMIHSSQKTFDEIRSFMAAYQCLDKCVPVVAVPSTYYTVTEAELYASGISICIYANHMLRAAYPRMQDVAMGILRSGTAAYVQNMISPVKEIINLLPNSGQVHDLPHRPAAQPDPWDASSRVDACDLVARLCDHGVRRFFGVPDSVLKCFCEAVDNASSDDDVTHVISCNEGAALATAAGWQLATGEVPVVYCQNSGFGNMVNPLMSLSHGDAFAVPSVLLIGWRGEPGVPDEPQHQAQGRQMVPMLESCNLRVMEMPRDTAGAVQTIVKARDLAQSSKRAVAVLVHHKSFASAEEPARASPGLSRASAVRETALFFENTTDFVVSTTGYTSRELYKLQKERGLRVDNKFFMVGSMGHALSIAQGVALAQPGRRVWCLDGDGAVLMHMGSMVSTHSLALHNLVHVVLNNSCHESVGGQSTAASQARGGGGGHCDLTAMAKAVGYGHIYRAVNEKEIRDFAQIIAATPGSAFLEIVTGADPEQNAALPRPQETLVELKDACSKFLSTLP